MLRAVGVLRGWVNGSGLPDETKGGRQIMKDFCDGRLLWFEYPPGYQGEKKDPREVAAAAAAAAASRPQHGSLSEEVIDEGTRPSAAPVGDAAATSGATAAAAAAAAAAAGGIELEDALMLDSLDLGAKKDKAKRPDYKFHKKQKRDKGTRGKGAFGIQSDGTEDGLGIVYGKRGGIIRVAGYL